jgi:hypothetical protein
MYMFALRGCSWLSNNAHHATFEGLIAKINKEGEGGSLLPEPETFHYAVFRCQ